jgi:hypothetical protein
LKKQGHWKDEYENKKPAAGTRTTP